jgi:hypothetical protein
MSALNPELLEHYNAMEDDQIMAVFGNWTQHIEQYKEQYLSDVPFPNVIIPDFLESSFGKQIMDLFPEVDSTWHKYSNPIEVKYANDRIDSMPEPIQRLFYMLSTKCMTKLFCQLSGIAELEYDPFLHGAGLHAHPRHGRLGLHLDYEKHPTLENKERRLNIILYLSPEWDQAWGGATELWNEDVTACIKRSPVKANYAIVFRTDGTSWHGLPEPLRCPEGVFRRSFAYYYISPLVTAADANKFGNDGDGYRKKASFIRKPDDPPSTVMDSLYSIRPHRRITQGDLQELCPDWDPSKPLP